jgi:hypothetical protein
MLKILDKDKPCFRRNDYIKLKTLAHKESKDWSLCVKTGQGSRDEEVQKWVNLCAKRAANPG